MQRLEDELNQRELEVKVKTEAIQAIVYEAHHRGLNPIFKTCRGIINLMKRTDTRKESAEYIELLENHILKAEAEEMKRIGTIEHLQ